MYELAQVSIPWGDWTVSAISALQPVVTLVLTGVTTYIMSAFVPPWIKAFAGDAAQRRINEVLTHAVQSGIAQTAGAVAGKRATIPIGSEILQRAAQYAIDQAPNLVTKAASGQIDNLLKMVLARMETAGVAPTDFDIKNVNKSKFPVDVNKQFGK